MFFDKIDKYHSIIVVFIYHVNICIFEIHLWQNVAYFLLHVDLRIDILM